LTRSKTLAYPLIESGCTSHHKKHRLFTTLLYGYHGELLKALSLQQILGRFRRGEFISAVE
jgi:hypothetical protein